MGADQGRVVTGILFLTLLSSLAHAPGHRVADAQAPATPQPLDIVGHLGGAAEDVVLDGRHAYVATGYAFEVWDVQDPAHPVRTGQLERTGCTATRGCGPDWWKQRALLDGHRIYLTDRGRIRIIDVADPSAPREVGSFGVEAPGIDSVAPNGTYIYAAVPSGNIGVVVVDVSDPAKPVEVRRTGDGRYERVAMIGPFLFAFGYTSVDPVEHRGWRVYDVSSPALPAEVSVTEATGYPYDIAVGGTHLYVGTNQGLRVYRATDPLSVQQVALVETPGPVDSVDVEGGRAYIVYGGVVEILDVTDPASPRRPLRRVQVAPMEGTAGFSGLAAVGDVVLVTHPNSGVSVVDVSTPGPMREIARFADELPGWIWRVAVAGDHAYVAGRMLYVVDVSDKARPVVVGSYDPGGLHYPIRDVAVQGSRLYLAVWTEPRHELHILDVEGGGDPRLIAVLDIAEGSTGGVVVRGDYAYVAGQVNDAATSTSTRLLHVVDVAGASGPRVVGDLRIPGTTPSAEGHPELVLAGTHLLLGTSLGFANVDVSDPTRPRLASRFEWRPNWIRSVTACGANAYVAFNPQGTADDSSLGVVDIADPESPVVVATSGPKYAAQSLALSADHLFTGADSAVQMFGIAQPESIRRSLKTRALPASALSLALRGGYAYVADNDAGLFILYTGDADVPDDVPPTPMPTLPPTAVPTLPPSATPRPTDTAWPTTPPTSTPAPTATAAPTSAVDCICRTVYRRVPPQVIADAAANPGRFDGWQKPLNPGKRPGPNNPLRTCLSLRNVSNPYHPLWNAVVWRVGCQ
jgi:hypothetical protein